MSDFDYADEQEIDEHPYVGPWTVCLFIIDQAYGGHEEGGWWYTYGDPVITTHVQVFSDLDLAKAYRDRLDTVAEEMNVGRPKISDSNSIGRFSAMVCEGWPKAFPDRVPRYS
jgi:hypothetical protein